MDGRLPFNDLDLTSQRPKGLNAGQNELLRLIVDLSGDAGQWTGPRSDLAGPLGCSVDTVTRRKDKLVRLGLLETVPMGRVMTYKLLSSSVAAATNSVNRPTRPATSTKPNRRWWKRPDANQLDLFDEPTTRIEAATRLAATTLHWMSLVVSLVVGPAAKRKERPATPTTIHAKPATKPTTPAAKPAAPPTTPATFSPAPIEPIPISTPTSGEHFQRPTKPIEENGRSLRKFTLWRNAKDAEFREPAKIQEVFERHCKAGLSTPDQRLAVFKCVISLVESAKPTDRLPGLITAVLRGAGSTPWNARGSADDERKAREMIRSLDLPAGMQSRTSNLASDEDEFERRKNELRAQGAAMLAVYGQN